MPALTTVTLDMNYAFYHKRTVHTKSSSPSSPSLLDITSALQEYLQFIVSFTHYSFSIHNSRSSIHPHNTIHQSPPLYSPRNTLPRNPHHLFVHRITFILPFNLFHAAQSYSHPAPPPCFNRLLHINTCNSRDGSSRLLSDLLHCLSPRRR